MGKYTVKTFKKTADLAHLQNGCPVYCDREDNRLPVKSFELLENAHSYDPYSAQVTISGNVVVMTYSCIIAEEDDGSAFTISSTRNQAAEDRFNAAIRALALALLQKAQDAARERR